VAQGYIREVAAQAWGIAATTVYRWMKRGEPDRPFGEFCTALKRADAEAEIACLRTIKAAANAGDWKAAAWMLERRYPEKWGRRPRGAQAGLGGLQVEWGKLTQFVMPTALCD
jgi:transposase